MRGPLQLAIALILGTVVPLPGSAQQSGDVAPRTVLFVCDHGTVRSLLAKVLFDEYAEQVGLHVRAVARGTQADSSVPAWMQQGLVSDHVALGPWRPQTLRPTDLSDALHVFSFDVPSGARGSREQWNGLPSVSKDYARGRDAIKVRVHALVDSLKRAETRVHYRTP